MSELPFPFTIEDVETNLNQQFKNDFTGFYQGIVQIGPEKWILPSDYKNHAKKLYNFKVRPDDTWIVTFPRSGTTWTQEMTWLIANDLNYRKAQDISLLERFPFLEFNLFFCNQTKEKYLKIHKNDSEKQQFIKNMHTPGYEILENISSPRFIKTHLPFSLLPPSVLNSKVIYIARNPKDVAVSYYHLNRLIKTQGFKGDFEKFWNYFEKNLVPWAPYWDHIREGWEKRHHSNVLFLFYEDIVKDIKHNLKKIMKFYNKEYSEEEIDKLAEYLKIDNFRNNKSVNFNPMDEIGLLNKDEQGFVRKGKSGEWQQEYTPQLKEQAEQWIKNNQMKTKFNFFYLEEK